MAAILTLGMPAPLMGLGIVVNAVVARCLGVAGLSLLGPADRGGIRKDALRSLVVVRESARGLVRPGPVRAIPGPTDIFPRWSVGVSVGEPFSDEGEESETAFTHRTIVLSERQPLNATKFLRHRLG